jgi:type II secretory pathway pseudopilin PulG
MARRRHTEDGFSLIDVMIAITILMVGILALTGAMVGALVKTEESEEELVAKQYMMTAVESIFSARDVASLGFPAAKNATSGCTGGTGKFCAGVQNILTSSGTDGIFGTSDDTGSVVSGYTRQIAITNVNDANTDEIDDTTGFPVSLRQITVTVFYKVRGKQRQVSLTTFIGDYRYVN